MINNPSHAMTKGSAIIDAVFLRFFDKIESKAFTSYFGYHKPIISFIEVEHDSPIIMPNENYHHNLYHCILLLLSSLDRLVIQ